MRLAGPVERSSSPEVVVPKARIVPMGLVAKL